MLQESKQNKMQRKLKLPRLQLRQPLERLGGLRVELVVAEAANRAESGVS